MVRFISDFFLNILYMPKNNINYSNTIIYKIVCNDLNVKELYIGSTTDFYNRKSNHKYKCNSENDKNYNLNIYNCIRVNGGWDNWSMIEIEKFPCKDSMEARSRESYWCEQLNATLNSNKPYLTNNEIKAYQSEYKLNNKDKILEYYQNNKNKIAEYYKQKQECVCGSKYTINHKQKHLKSNKHLVFINNKNKDQITLTLE